MTPVDLLEKAAAAAPQPARDLGGQVGRALARVFGSPGDGDLDDRDPDFIRERIPAVWLLVSLYFRAEVRGLELLPREGPLLLVGNHSGGLVMPDTVVFTLAHNAYFGPERRLHPLAHDAVLSVPGLGGWLRRIGVLPAAKSNAARVLDAEGAVLVYPGGDHEVFRPSWRGDKIDLDGRKGFVRLALDHDVPIAPVVSIGGQESALFLSDGEDLARLLRLDRYLRLKVLPVSVTIPWGFGVLDNFLGHVPLPTKITVRVLEPYRLRERFGPDPDIDEVYDAVVTQMQSALDGLAAERSLPVVG